MPQPDEVPGRHPGRRLLVDPGAGQSGRVASDDGDRYAEPVEGPAFDVVEGRRQDDEGIKLAERHDALEEVPPAGGVADVVQDEPKAGPHERLLDPSDGFGEVPLSREASQYADELWTVSRLSEAVAQLARRS
jgi:hypothetical protein